MAERRRLRQMRAEEKRIVTDLTRICEANAKIGDDYYVINKRWWDEWVLYVKQNNDNRDRARASGNNINRPSRINNSDLISEAASEDSIASSELREGLVEGFDYILLPQAIWNQLCAWYGGGPAFARKLISSGLSGMYIEVYPLRLHLHLMPRNEESTIRISKRGTIGDLHQRACKIFYLAPEQVLIWDYYGKRKHALLNDMHKALEDANIQMDHDILVELVGSIKESGGATKKTTAVAVGGGLSTSTSVSKNSSFSSSQAQSSTSRGRELENAYGSSGVTTKGSSAGLTGLANLGNTCYMNSTIQCLVHTPQFARYFRGDYHKEINRTNRLGMKGELALAFGQLLQKLWSPGRNSIVPRSFKAKLAKFASRFSGDDQHDAQELLAFLLDGLHEDLNRVKDRPDMKLTDANGRSDEEMADEYWRNYVARNDSIIVDVCQGQFKSTLVCSVCSRVSMTFDPFMYLSLPLQSTKSRSMTVTVFTHDGSKLPNTCTVTIPKQGYCRDLIQAIHYACSLEDNENILLAEVSNHQILLFLEDPLFLLSSIKDDYCLVAYKIPKVVKNAKYLELIHRREQKSTGSSHKKGKWKPFGTPLVSPIVWDESIKVGDIQLRVRSMLSPLLRNQILGHADISECETSSEKKLPLKLVDEKKVLADISVEDDKQIKLSSASTSVKVVIDWSDELLESYDIQSLENLPEVYKYGSIVKKGRTEPITLYNCLEAFLREEPLVSDDMWNCPQCKEQRQASKKLDLWRLPEVLVIHLKRFSYRKSVKHKLETFVDFPVYNLDLTKYVAKKKNPRGESYNLFALTNHYGSMASGHYTAYVKSVEENRWYNFDDNYVIPLDEDQLKSPAAYVLYYKRVNSEDAFGDNGGLS